MGGWASSTICGARSRRYHGLLVAATYPPVARMVLLSKLDETIVLNEQRFELGCNFFPNAIHPKGFEHLKSFTKTLFPIFEYEVAGLQIRKTIAAVHGENTTLILYEILQAPSAFSFELQPFIAFRNFHSLTQANNNIRPDVDFNENTLKMQPYADVTELFLAVPGAEFESRPQWYYNFQYPVEQFRGLDFQEDLFTHGVFNMTLKSRDKLGVIISTLNPKARDAFKLFENEKQRRRELFTGLTVDDEFTRILTLAADQFIVQRGGNLRTIIAGYHWFADWGRDTMIALPGLCLVTGRFDDAKKILRAFAQSVSQGMLPNRFPDVG
ncbi:MAG: glycogen debranching enzyme N-terminal domain-containing protein, partial [bacterium]